MDLVCFMASGQVQALSSTHCTVVDGDALSSKHCTVVDGSALSTQHCPVDYDARNGGATQASCFAQVGSLLSA